MRLFKPKQPELFVFANPCSESWETMAPDNCGRHCSKCDKIVHDFGNLSDEQIVQRIQGSIEKPCVRTVKRNRSMRLYLKRVIRWGLAACLVFYLQIKKSLAQSIDEKGQTIIPNTKEQDKPKIQRIAGTIVDDKTEDPMVFATVIVKGEHNQIVYGTFTDEEGKFSIPLSDTSLKGNLQISVRYIGYQDTTFSIPVVKGAIQDLRWLRINSTSDQSEELHKVPIRLSRGCVIMGDVVSIVHRPNLNVQSIGNNKSYNSEEIERYNLLR